MKPGDLLLVSLPLITGGAPKLRPALVLALLPGPYQTLLVCGISGQMHDLTPNWDEVIGPADPDWAESGLHRESAFRLSYLYAAGPNEVGGLIGRVSRQRLVRLLKSLSGQLKAPLVDI